MNRRLIYLIAAAFAAIILAIFVLSVTRDQHELSSEETIEVPNTSPTTGKPLYCTLWLGGVTFVDRLNNWTTDQNTAQAAGIAASVGKSETGVVREGAIAIAKVVSNVAQGIVVTPEQSNDALTKAKAADVQARVECSP